jgi:hypothetical protein
MVSSREPISGIRAILAILVETTRHPSYMVWDTEAIACSTLNEQGRESIGWKDWRETSACPEEQV